MAQIIQHKRGVLEDLSGVTPNKGELLVVTGSSISALADGLVFVGNHSDLTSVNKILTGSSSPDLSSYDVGVNGLPFYNTTDKNLQILRQDGNIDIVLKHNKVDFGGSTILSGSLVSPNNNVITLAVGGGLSVSADADFTLNQNSDQTITISTDGSNIVSGSSQTIAHLGGSGVISSSAQIDSDFFDIDGLVSSSTQVQAYGVFAELNGDNLVSSSAQIDDLGFLKVDGDNVISSSAQLTGTFLEINGDNVISASAQVTGIVNSQIDASAAIAHTKIDFGGSNITSGSLNLSIAGDSGTDTVTVGSDTFTFAGTANEIETAVTDNQVQIGIVTNPTLTGNVIITGNLTVSGDTVQTNVSTMNVEDNIINLNYGGSQTTGGIYVTDATGGNTVSGSIIWDGTNDYWKAGAKDSEARVILGNGTDTAGTITKFSADGVITDSIITESGTTVTISNDLILSGLTASAFLVSNGSKQLVSVSTTTDGDILVSDGAGNFSATNTIDGGSF